MTKKDYKLAARLIAQFSGHFRWPGHVEAEVIDLFSAFFRDDNSRFDEVRFAEACEAEGEEIRENG